ncbi:SKN1-domain-containing protein [Fistulina hepatica ATCC 64428]|uniref:SKN1-domain-containing protein n=1 Tax=Fistulina hepatica ATCC 64428 TaxID=1128425 RepID=A0A0D7AGH1_9AGAR|nr:SKN1-domain-containing protein [Fistulina hepatica ATCC 64428]
MPRKPFPMYQQSSQSTLKTNFDAPNLNRCLSVDRFVLSPDPESWGTNLFANVPEPDDDLYTPSQDGHRETVSYRAVTNVGCLILLLICLLGLFLGYPVSLYAASKLQGTHHRPAFIPQMFGRFDLIDPDTPAEARTVPSWADSSEQLTLVFSDEFNADGRSFYPGDDPFWEAVDLHYWATNNLEWYSSEAVSTSNGSLVIELSKKETHNLHYQGGISVMNKFCFTGGYIETSAVIPGTNDILGLWPAVWAMGNLGRAGYGASLEGMWPYTYDSCDIGTVANQSINGQPAAAMTGGVLSYLPGQRLSRCTCLGEDHPGPVHPDGSFVGRAAPEIDIFEAQFKNSYTPQVSQSAQWAPFNHGYIWDNTSDNLILANPAISALNGFTGSATQQATSVVTETNRAGYEDNGAQFEVYGFQYKTGFDDGYITWISSNEIAWTLKAPGMGPDSEVEIDTRPIPPEPMYIIANLGMSWNFGFVDLDHLPFPMHMRLDYIRVYQPANAVNVGCSPVDYPTEPYINRQGYIAVHAHMEAYTNPNLTTWRGDYGQPWPKNSFLGQC